MRNSIKSLLFLLLLSSLSCFFSNQGYQQRKLSDEGTISPLVLLPTSLVEALSLEFKGIVSDFMMLNTLTFLGEKIILEDTLTQSDWKRVYRSFDHMTTLDPMATDPFILATTTLPYEAGMVGETNKLLEKVALVRTEDHRPYFFLYHNHSFFLKDTRKAAEYLKKAARIKGAPSFYATLAARLNLYSGDLLAAILFTKEILNDTTDATQRKYLLLRLEALEKIAFLEKNILQFKRKYQRKPKNLKELIETNMIETIPDDPYGGDFYIQDNGRVYTTSELVLLRKKNK